MARAGRLKPLAPHMPKLFFPTKPQNDSAKNLQPTLGGGGGRRVKDASARARDLFMFSSVGQIVGLIEIDPAESGDQFFTALQFEAGLESDAQDASLGELFARLAGRLAPDPGQSLPENSTFSVLPVNRLALSGTGPGAELVLDADLAGLEAELAETTGRLRLQLVEAGSGGR
jgi:hypothetical protein